MWPEEESKSSEKEELDTALVQQLISMYNKAIEFYSAVNDERHLEILQKL